MLVTSVKPMEEIRQGALFALPQHLTLEPWISRGRKRVPDLNAKGIRVGFWNSVKIVIPSTIISIMLGALNGYALSFWRVRGANLLYGVLMLGAFVPYQVRCITG